VAEVSFLPTRARKGHACALRPPRADSEPRIAGTSAIESTITSGVALDPAPPKGVLRIAYSEFKSLSPVLLHPSKRQGVVTLTLEQFHFGFTNTFTPEVDYAKADRAPPSDHRR